MNPDNLELLSPRGVIGEMLYEGPGLLEKHLGDLKKTKEVLIDALFPPRCLSFIKVEILYAMCLMVQ